MSRSTVFSLCLLGLLALASANIYEMSDATEAQCKASNKCWIEKCKSETPMDTGRKLLGDNNDDCTRIGFFDCLDNEIDLDDDENQEFYNEITKVFNNCEQHEQKDANGKDVKETKHVKCMLKKVKKDACDWYF